MNLMNLNTFRCGIERETLRVDQNGNLSEKPHPKGLGSPLTHPHISTDFGEAQLEWNTPPLSTFASAEKFLHDLMSFSAEKIQDELYWPFSMPCPLTNVQIAQYGSSNEGRKKEIYRAGLKCRYGRNLQMLSSIHFNFSFPIPFWKSLHRREKSALPLQDFISEKYLHIIRNFLREGWLLTYLFGTSPAMDETYMESPPKEFQKIGQTLYSPYATSIRMSHLGYYSRIQTQQAISFNSLSKYIEEMELALSTHKSEYESIPTQLNSNLLQIENEHYTRIRPKSLPHKGESPLDAIKKRGIEYVEVRAIDLDPYHPIGMSREHICFLHLFLLTCLFQPSPKLSKQEQICLTCDQNKVALEGRKEGLTLTKGKTLKYLGQNILKKMEPHAKKLGYERVLQMQKEKLQIPSLTPSALILADIQKRGMVEMGVELAKLHKKTFLKTPLSSTKYAKFTEEVSQSLLQATWLETASKVLVPGYESLELSTQVLIREALNQGIQVEVLDWKESFIKLTKGKHIEYVKQATKTSKDSYIIPHIFENKHVTKLLLREKGFRVPDGYTYSTIEDALKTPLKGKMVVKPKSTNFGIGISFVNHKNLKEAVTHAFTYGDSVLIEEYCPGNEYRFLVVGGEVLGIVMREPANVVGDGKHTIKELVQLKNYDPHYYRDEKIHLHLGKEEKKVLSSLRLRPTSVLKKGKKVFLRDNSNVSTGGDAIDMTDEVHKGYNQIARDATAALGAHICGVDMMIQSPQKAPTEGNHVIIEMNYNPVLFFHAFPYKGKGRDVATPLLKLLFEV